MQILLCALLLTIPFLSPQSNSPEVFDLVVTEKTPAYTTVTWECPDEAGKACSLRIPKDEWARGSYRYWPERVITGQLLKATFLVGRLKSIPGCDVRLAEARIEHTQGLGGKTPTNSLMPEDCSRPTSAFITALLEKMTQ